MHVYMHMYIYICIHVNNSCMEIYKSSVDIMSIFNTDVAKWYNKYNVALCLYKKYDVALCLYIYICLYL